ncbi:Os10g0357950 [Oryza sativa Japonica Group]|uniref:Os10g0357950 protein n=1 Tax=Oryza sativa subsp. japonica TaxID=39947 RepID=A0A0N7KRN1_ORYSJ|nr:Os10g0357950 [Oryza sativa Japonica Group]
MSFLLAGSSGDRAADERDLGGRCASRGYGGGHLHVLYGGGFHHNLDLADSGVDNHVLIEVDVVWRCLGCHDVVIRGHEDVTHLCLEAGVPSRSSMLAQFFHVPVEVFLLLLDVAFLLFSLLLLCLHFRANHDEDVS